MNAKNLWMSSLLLLPLGAVTASAFSREKQAQDKQATPASSPTDDPMMAKMKELGTPGPAHKILEPLVGKWTADAKMYMDGKAQPTSKANSEMKWILDGHYVQDTYMGDFMGQKFTGIGTTGYDNLKKKYVTTWMDSMSTAIFYAEGTYDAAAKTFTFNGECPDLMTGKITKNRMVQKWTDNDHFTMTAYKTGADGKEAMEMEIAYTRAK